MFEILVVIAFVWLLFKALGLVFKIAWGGCEDRCIDLNGVRAAAADSAFYLCWRRCITDPHCNDRNCSSPSQVLCLMTDRKR